MEYNLDKIEAPSFNIWIITRDRIAHLRHIGSPVGKTLCGKNLKPHRIVSTYYRDQNTKFCKRCKAKFGSFGGDK